MPTNYVILDASNNVLNLIVWDGNTQDWQPPDGCTVEVADFENYNYSKGQSPQAIKAP